ncbi:MAG: hypothetical protein PSV46_10620 [Reyranella sp.]|nr:hypothetical protein [Reyranella sp.]
MSSASNSRRAAGGLVVGAIGVALIALSTAAPGSRASVRCECERGLLDAGQDGMNVLVYELCPEQLTVGFRSSDVIEEISCGPDGEVRLWMSTDDERCEGEPTGGLGQAYDLWEPLRGPGRATAAPVRKLLTCRGQMNRATIVVPDARDALLETRPGDTLYEQLTRRFIAQCIRPAA